MNENDNKIRKQWLLMLILSFLISFVTTFFDARHNPAYHLLPMARYWIAALKIFSGWIFAYVTYRCVYKKPGTKLLNFILIMTAIGLVITPVLYLSGKIQIPAYFPYYRAFNFLTQVTGALWLGISWRMRKINKRLQSLSNPS